jgi:hypothetical protein
MSTHSIGNSSFNSINREVNQLKKKESANSIILLFGKDENTKFCEERINKIKSFSSSASAHISKSIENQD